MTAHESAWGQDVLSGVDEIAVVLRVGRGRVKALIRTRELPVVREGRSWVITRRALLDWLDGRAKAPKV